MRDIGIRIQRYRLRRYQAPETIGEKARLGLAIALALWGIWALFVSDHSAVRLMGLERKQKVTEAKLAAVERAVAISEEELAAAGDPRVAERVLRKLHNFAREGEILYVIQPDGAVRSAPASLGAPADSAR